MKKAIVLLSLYLFIIEAIYSQSLTIKLNPEINKSYRFKTISNQTLTQTMGNNDINTDIITNATISLKIVDKTKDFFVCELRYDTMYVNTKNISMNIEINSVKTGNIKSNNINEVISAIINRYCNTPIFLKINNQGLVTEIINYEIFKNIILKDIDSVNSSIQPQVKMQIINMISEKQIKNSVEQIFNYLPENQEINNNSWKKTSIIESNGMKLNTENNYKIVKTENENIIINFESNIRSTSDNVSTIQGNKVQYDLKGISKGNIKVNVNNGFIIEQSSKTSIEGFIMIEYGGNNMNIPTKIFGETKIMQI